MTQLIAPNGKPSNLTPEQWKLVRTSQFKAWFGDWENDPENASKVVDENGEPLVVYHGTSYDFNVFKIGRMGGLFFTDNLSYAERFASGDMKRQGEKSKMLKCFLNARKCYDKNTHDETLIDDYYNKFVEEGTTKLKKKERLKYVKSLEDKYKDFFINLAGFSMLDSNRKNHLLLHNYDCIITDGYSDTKFYVVFEPNQIKLADGTNTTFDGSNPDIRFEEGGKVEKLIMQGVVDLKMYNTTTEHSKVYGFECSNPLYIQRIFVNENERNNGIGVDVLKYLDEYAKENNHDLIFGHIQQKAEPSVDAVKGMLRKNGYSTIEGNNDFYKYIDLNTQFAEGGKTKRTMKRIKRGGITYGKSHAEGGIPVKNQSTGDMLEVEGGEGIVNKRSMASDKKVKLNGKEMTICEAVSQLNQLEGGVQFSCDDVSDRQFIEAMAKGGELERGTRTEQEHIQVLKDLYAKRITPKEASKRIAKDHLKEDSQYYSKLAKMEGKMADGGKVSEKQLLIDYQNEFLQNRYSKNIDEIRTSSDYPYVIKERLKMAKSYARKKIAENKPKRFFDVTYRTTFGAYHTERNVLAVDQNEAWSEVRKYNSDIEKKYSIVLSKSQPKTNEQKMAKGGEIFDKETEDYLSELTKKFAKGGEVVADKTETINMKDFEGYADQYNGRKNKFFKATDEYQLLVNEGMDVKNNKDLPQDEKDKLLAELRDKAREAKSKLNEERKDFVDMREVKSPFYAPQLADGGKITKADTKAIDRGEGGTYKIKLKHPYFPSKGIDAYLKIDSQSMQGSLSFTIGSRNIDVEYPKEVITDVLEKARLSPRSYQIFGKKEAKSLNINIDFNFTITSENAKYILMEVLKALTNKEYYYQSVIGDKKEESTTPPPTEKEDDWNWRFKTEDELRAELGGDLHKLKDGNVFAISMRYLLGKKIKETTESVDAIFRINQSTYSGINVNTEKEFGISNPERDNEWSISKWMITDKPLEGEAVPPTEEKKEITHMDTETEIMRWAGEKVKEKNDVNTRKYQVHHLVAYILLNQSNARMSDFTQLIAMAKQTEKLSKEVLRLTEEGIPLDSFVMKLVLNRYLESLEDVKSQIMLFVKYERDVEQELGRIVLNIPYIAELDTFDKDYILYIK